MLQYVVALVLIYLSLKVFISRAKPQNADGKPMPPGVLGFYHIKEALDFFKNVTSWGLERKRKYGDIFTSNVFFNKSIAGGGQEFNRWWAREDNGALKMEWPTTLHRMFGDHSILTMNGDAHTRMRKMLLAAFTPRALESYMDITSSLTLQLIDKLPLKPVSVQTTIKRFMFSVGCTILIGRDFGDQNDEMLSQYQAWQDGNDAFPINLPFFKFYKCMKARSFLLKVFEGFARQPASSSPPSTSPASAAPPSPVKNKTACELLIEEGQLEIEEITETLLVLLSAGHETTSSAICSLLMFLEKNKTVYDKLMNEIDVTFSDSRSTLDFIRLRSMPYLDAVIRETLRMIPPIPAHFRKAAEDTEVNGYYVPAGYTIVGLPCVAHFDEKLFPDPDQFNPERFLNGSAPSHSIFTFGDGPRQCLGMELARLNMKIFIVQVMRRMTWQIVGPIDLQLYVPAMPEFGVVFRSKEVCEMSEVSAEVFD